MPYWPMWGVGRRMEAKEKENKEDELPDPELISLADKIG